ncbi:arginine decarboxylase [Helicobacter bizzozeronii]|uniref:arginine decarboxylase n=1 Tax=Helicobacter bizzozeronii TaxID=56877 RepID=UPI00024E60CD|nr:arginine decarboxylase [Helicobacter bizzozeronii]CCF81308.1 Arginine decarboxylase [Helicobacter bizzozeronii CCUG 35545]
MQTYGLEYWGREDFVIEGGLVKLNVGSKPSLMEIVMELREQGFKGPLLLRFPHLIEKQVKELFNMFSNAINQYHYSGAFKAVFPLKVNHMPHFVLPLVEISKAFKGHYGLEAGSKAELILAMSYVQEGAPITVNGFKDKEMIELGFIAASMGADITLTIEGLSELKSILEVALENNTTGENAKLCPKIGIRVRLHSSGVGIWAKSTGIHAKFGLASTELLEAMRLLEEHALLGQLSMIHFHIGSQISDITPLKKALKEAGNIYAELRKMGAFNLKSVNIGGGLAIEYSQHKHQCERNYTLEEFAGDVVFLLKEIVKNKKELEPNIFIESGRFISASHAVLVAPVLELFSQDYDESILRLKETNPPLVAEMEDLYHNINAKNAIEYLHDSLDHMESLFTLFDLGYIDLQDRSNAEVLGHLIIKKAIGFFRHKDHSDIIRIQEQVQERYLLNCSFFQSLPDYWGLRQNFPVMPLHKLDQEPTRSASLWDITCDSDGEISFNKNKPLFLHEVDVRQEEYFLGFFLVGAYQEVLGMHHNLFTHPTECCVHVHAAGAPEPFSISHILEAQTILDALEDLEYDTKEMERILKQKIEESALLDSEEKKEVLGRLYVMLSENGYLRTLALQEL